MKEKLKPSLPFVCWFIAGIWSRVGEKFGIKKGDAGNIGLGKEVESEGVEDGVWFEVDEGEDTDVFPNGKKIKVKSKMSTASENWLELLSPPPKNILIVDDVDTR